MSGFKKTEIGFVPENWQVVELGAVCTQRKEVVTPNSNGKGKYVGLEHIQTGVFRLKNYGNEGEVKSAKYKFHDGDILYGKLRPYLDKAVLVDLSGICSTDIIVLKGTGQLLQSYLIGLVHTNYFIEYSKRTTSGVNHPRTSWNLLKKFKFGLPTLEEQRNIAHILSQIQSAIKTQEKIIQTTTELKKALMQKLFTEGLHGEPQKEDGEIKSDTVKLGILAEKGIVEFQNGFPCGQWNESGVGIPQLRPFNVTDFGKIDLTQIKYIETNKSVEKYKLKQNDIIFNNTNSEELVGKTALCQNGDGYVLSNHMTIIRIKDANSINPTYLANFLHKKWFDGHYKMVCRRHVNQASVSIERLKDIDLPYPPIDIQNKIAKSFRVIDKKIEFANVKHQTLQVLFSSMLHHLMTGQIRVKDLRFS